jgi:hypothetical protein
VAVVWCAQLGSDLGLSTRTITESAGSNLAINRLDSSTIAGSTGDGYRLAELMATTNPSRWSGVLKVRNPAGTEGHILLYSDTWALDQSKLEDFADCLEP